MATSRGTPVALLRLHYVKFTPFGFLERWTKLFRIAVLQQKIKTNFQTYLIHFTCFHFFFFKTSIQNNSLTHQKETKLIVLQ